MMPHEDKPTEKPPEPQKPAEPEPQQWPDPSDYETREPKPGDIEKK